MKKMILLSLLLCIGCSESTHLALEQSKRIEEVRDQIVSNQEDVIRMLMFRDLVNYTQQVAGRELTESELSELNEFMNNRDLVQFWAVQWERARSLELVTVIRELESQLPVWEKIGGQTAKQMDRIAVGLDQADSE